MHTNTLVRIVLLLGLLSSGPVLAQAPSATLDRIEVTQAIQDLDNSVPFVAGKKTMIRAYLTLSAGPPLQLHNGGRLVISPSSGSPMTIDSINNPTLTSQPQTGPKRQTLDGTLNFVLDSPTAGTYTLTIEDSLKDNGSSAIPCPNCGTNSSSYKVTPVFHQSPHLRIKLIPVRYYDSMNLKYTNDIPTSDDFKYIRSWIKRTFPVGESNLEVTEWSPPPEGSMMPLAETNWYTIDQTPWTESGTPYKEISCNSTNAELLIMRQHYIQIYSTHADFPMDFPSTHLHGLLADRSQEDADAFKGGCTDLMGPQSTPAAYFSRPGSGPTGQVPQSELVETDLWDSDMHYGDWYTAHEIGHALGLKHLSSTEPARTWPARTCDPNIEEAESPDYTNGYLSEPDPYPKYFGYDAGDSAFTPTVPRAILQGTDWHDLMTYCDKKWISNISYQKIWCRLYVENGSTCPPSAGDTIPPAAPINLQILQNQRLSTSHLFFKEHVGTTNWWDFALPGFMSEPNIGGRNNGFAILLPQHSRAAETIGGETLRHTQKNGSHETAQFGDRALLVDHTLSPHTAKRYLLIEVGVNLKSSMGRIVSTMLTSLPSAKVGTEDNRAKIRLLDARNQPLSEVPIATPTGKTALSMTGQTDWALVEMEFVERTKVVELVVNGQPVARREVTTAAPTVENIRVRQPGGDMIPRGMVVFEWDSDDADGGDRSYMVDLSRDRGATWRPFIGNLTRPVLALPLKHFAGTSIVILKVTASDGFNTTTVNSSQFAISTRGGTVHSP